MSGRRQDGPAQAPGIMVSVSSTGEIVAGPYAITALHIKRSSLLSSIRETPGSAFLALEPRLFEGWYKHVSISRMDHLDLVRLVELWETSTYMQDERTCQELSETVGNAVSQVKDWSSPANAELLDRLSSAPPELAEAVFLVVRNRGSQLKALLPALPVQLHAAVVMAFVTERTLNAARELPGELLSLAAAQFQHLSHLRKLDLEACHLQWSDIPADAFTNLVRLEELVMDHNSNSAFTVLSQPLQRLPALTKLSLAPDDLTSRQAAEGLASSLAPLTKLKVLSFMAGPCPEHALAALAASLGKLSALQELTIRGLHIADGVDPTQFTKPLGNLSALERLSLADSALTEHSVVVLAATLERLSALKNLDLSGNSSGPAGAAALASAFRGLKALRNVDIRGNDIGEGGANQLAEAFKHNGMMRSLILSMNGIGALGGAALGQVIRRLGNLRRLYLAANGLEDEGSAALARGLLGLTCLRELDLGVNGIGQNGAASLARALVPQAQLAILDLQNNTIGDEGAGEITTALAASTKLKLLDLSFNFLSPGGAARTQQAVTALPAVRLVL